MDWTDCNNLAYTELRAANLSGDCLFSREVSRNLWKVSMNDCIKRRAITAVKIHPQCSSVNKAEVAIESMYSKSISDNTPFS